MRSAAESKSIGKRNKFMAKKIMIQGTMSNAGEKPDRGRSVPHF